MQKCFHVRHPESPLPIRLPVTLVGLEGKKGIFATLRSGADPATLNMCSFGELLPHFFEVVIALLLRPID